MRSDHRFEPSARAELAPASAPRQANRAKKHRARRAHSTEFFAAAAAGAIAEASSGIALSAQLVTEYRTQRCT